MGKTGYQKPGILAGIRAEIARNLGTPQATILNLNEADQRKKLWEGVEEDTGHPLLVHFAARLIDAAHVPPRDPVRLVRAFQLYSAKRIKFFRERPERFASALRTLVWGLGDCDDKARFVAALTRTFRIPARLKFLHMLVPDKTHPTGKRPVGHVVPQAWLPVGDNLSNWVCAESVRVYPLGYDPEVKARSKGIDVKVFTIGDAGEDQAWI